MDAGEWIDTDSEFYPAYQSLPIECGLKMQKYNSTAMTSVDEMRSAMEDLTGRKMIGESIVVFPFRCEPVFNIYIVQRSCDPGIWD